MSNNVLGTGDTAVNNSHGNNCPPGPEFGMSAKLRGKTQHAVLDEGAPGPLCWPLFQLQLIP